MVDYVDVRLNFLFKYQIYTPKCASHKSYVESIFTHIICCKYVFLFQFVWLRFTFHISPSMIVLCVIHIYTCLIHVREWDYVLQTRGLVCVCVCFVSRFDSESHGHCLRLLCICVLPCCVSHLMSAESVTTNKGQILCNVMNTDMQFIVCGF